MGLAASSPITLPTRAAVHLPACFRKSGFENRKSKIEIGLETPRPALWTAFRVSRLDMLTSEYTLLRPHIEEPHAVRENNEHHHDHKNQRRHQRPRQAGPV